MSKDTLFSVHQKSPRERNSPSIKEAYNNILRQLGNTLIAGTSGSGKSEFLRFVIKNTIRDVGFLIYASKSLPFLCLPSDKRLLLPIGRSWEDFEKLLSFLEKEVSKRRSGESFPRHIYVFVDELAAIPLQKEDIIRLESLMEHGPMYGVAFLITTQCPSFFTPKMMGLVNTKIAFSLFEGDKVAFCGNTDIDINEFKPGDCIVIQDIDGQVAQQRMRFPLI